MYDRIIPKSPWNTNWIVIQVAACVACSFANCPRRWSRLCIPAAVLTPRGKVEKTHTTLYPNEWILIFFLVATHPNWFSGGYKWCYATSHASYHTTATHEIRKQTQWTKIKFHTSTKTARILVYSIKQWWWGDTWQHDDNVQRNQQTWEGHVIAKPCNHWFRNCLDQRCNNRDKPIDNNI